jgi:hypothetical protein
VGKGSLPLAGCAASRWSSVSHAVQSIEQIVWMAVRAVRFAGVEIVVYPTFHGSVGRILTLRSPKQMLRVYARRDVATMTSRHAISAFASSNPQRKPVRPLLALADPE